MSEQEELEASKSVAYATRAELDEYIVGGIEGLGGVPNQDEYIDPILLTASRDLDRYIGAAWSVEDNGLRFGALSENPKSLDPAQLISVRRATCAQAEYRITQGEDFFRQDQHKSVSGPDFSTAGKLSRYGPKMREEIQSSGLRRATGGRLIR